MRVGPTEIPRDLWEVALDRLDEEKKKKKKNKKFKKLKGTLLLHFTFSLKDGKFIKLPNAQSTSNLFFSFAAANEDVSKEYIVVQMDDEDSLEETQNGTRTCFSYDVDPLREMILRNGIFVELMDENGPSESRILFNLMGCSNSQVQRHCYIFRRSKDLEENEAQLLQILPELKELEIKKGIPKRVKYTGLLFSGITPVNLPKELVVEEISSKEHNDFDFTDGPGLISRKLAILVKDQLGVAGGCPSIFQIRYCGIVSLLNGRKQGKVCKGVLVVDPRNDDTYKIQVRSSMLKISSSEKACSVLQTTLGICDYSQPSPGRLGQQLICLLSGVVERNDFIKLQKDHLDHVRNAFEDPFAMAWVFALDRRKNVWGNFHKLLLSEWKGSSLKSSQEVPPLYTKCAGIAGSHCRGPTSGKVQLPLAASRTLFGAVFPEILHDQLNEGECIVLLEDGPLRLKTPSGSGFEAVEETFVIVSRSPSYYPGDIRVLRVVSLPDGHPINELRNCILFSTQGDRPDPDKMGGGDLDGDKYLVVWHPVLLNYAKTLMAIPPARYDSPSSSDSSPSKDDWIHYAAQTDNAMLGEVENAFYKLAKQYGIDSPQIKTLNDLFASLVDRHPTSLSDFARLKSAVAGEMSSGDCIWEEMSAMQTECGIKRNLDESRWLLTYSKFQKATVHILRNPELMIRKISENFGFHFLESLQHKEILRTMSALEKLSSAGRATEFDEGNICEQSSKEEEEASGDMERSEMNSNEERDLAKFEERAYKLFKKHIKKVDEEIWSHKSVFNEHESKKKAICLQRDEEIFSLKQRTLDVEAEREKMEVENTARLTGRLRECEMLKKQLRNAWTNNIIRLRAKLCELNKELEELQNDLDKADGELGWGGFLMFFFPEAKREVAERKQMAEAEIDKKQKECESLKRAIEEETHQLQRKLKRLEISTQGEIDQIQDQHEKKLSEFDKELHNLKDAARDCLSRYECLLNGEEKKRLESLIKDKEAELRDLKEKLEVTTPHEGVDIDSFDFQCNPHFLQNSIDNLINELKCLKERVVNMFCPDTFDKAQLQMQELKLKKESLLIGRGHILHKVSQAKQHWKGRLKTEKMSRVECRKAWKAVVANLERVYTLEENRLLGFPREGKRKGSMPVYDKRSQLRDLLCNSQALIITAGTGCGKSTQIPQYVADDFYLYHQSQETAFDSDKVVRICCTQPRRVAAQKLAERVAEEYKTTLGDLVGFKVGSRGRSREECVKLSERTVIEFVTEGLLLFKLAKSPDFLEKYDAIIIDEMHERNTEQDLCLSLLRDYLAQSKASFKVVVMSASINAPRFCQYFNNCPQMDCPGRNFPVEEIYVPSGTLDGVSTYAADVLFEHIVNGDKDAGDVLIFLSGAGEIDECVSEIRSRASKTQDPVVAYPLYSKLDKSAISAATTPEHRSGPNGEMKGVKEPIRKVICSTNIAETSLTIDGVRFVIESGRAKKLRYDHSLRTSILSNDWVSHASTIQRKGRAGRTNKGFCYYLYSEIFHKKEMVEFDRPKILEESVDELMMLSLDVCGKSVEDMGLLDTPDLEDIKNAKERLLDLGFVEKDASTGHLSLTPDGQIARTFSSIRTESVRMMLTACKKYPHLTSKAINFAVLLSTTDSIYDKHKEVHNEDENNNVYGDHLLAFQHLEWFENAFKNTKKGKMKGLKKKCSERGLNFQVLKTIQEDVETCHKQLKKQKLFPSLSKAKDGTETYSEEQCLLRSMISGYFHRVVECVEPDFMKTVGFSHLTVSGVSLFLDKDSSLNNFLTTNQNEVAVIDEDYEPQNWDVNDLTTEEEEEVVPCFLLHGNLQKIDKIKKTFMLDVSVIEGMWVKEEAPNRWIERVSFETTRKNMCRITIKHIGSGILKECSRQGTLSEPNFFDELKHKFGLHVLIVRFEDRIIRLNGSQAATDKAKAAIQDKLFELMNERLRTDMAHNQTTGLRLGPGMEVKGRHQRQDKRLLHQILRAYGTDEKNLSKCRNVVAFIIDKKKSSVFVYPVHGLSMGSIKDALKNISDPKFTLKKEQSRFVIKFNSCNVQTSKGTWFDNAQKAVTILQRHKALSAVTVPCEFFSSKQQVMIAQVLGQEASRKSTLWQSFLKQLNSGRNKEAEVFFVQSQSYFTFGPKNDQLAAEFKNLVVYLSKALQYHQVEHHQVEHHQVEQHCYFKRYQIRRFASILAELKKCCPGVLFYIVDIRTTKDESRCNSEFLSDYTWLMGKVKCQEGVKSIRIGFVSLARGEEKKVKKLVSEKLSIEAFGKESLSSLKKPPKQCEWKQCVMCQRNILVYFGRNDKKSGRMRTLEGWNLTLCGCSYCRECFRNELTESLQDMFVLSARCLFCKRIILAKDCFEVIGSKVKWTQLCHLAEANYCQENLPLLTDGMKSGKKKRERGWATCPDCGFSMVFPSGYLFFICRNPNCGSRMCSRCCQVVVSEEVSKRCEANMCTMSQDEKYITEDD